LLEEEWTVSDSLEVSLARLEGKVDKIDVKLDSNRELLLDRIEAGDKESMQALRLVEQRVAEQEAKGNRRDERLDKLEEHASASDRFDARLIGMAVIIVFLVSAAGVVIGRVL
jgi:hypothetical protein